MSRVFDVIFKSSTPFFLDIRMLNQNIRNIPEVFERTQPCLQQHTLVLRSVKIHPLPAEHTEGHYIFIPCLAPHMKFSAMNLICLLPISTNYITHNNLAPFQLRTLSSFV